MILVPDRAAVVNPIAAILSDAESAECATLPDERRRRHYRFGRMAARAAIARLAGPRIKPSAIQVLAGENGEPRVDAGGHDGGLSVSISHSGGLAAACAWHASRAARLSVGIDVERLRPTCVADSPYAFSRRERLLLRRGDGDASRAGITAWSVKEAAWKALCPDPGLGPETVEIRELARGWAIVEPRGELERRPDASAIHVRFRYVHLPDGVYVVSRALAGAETAALFTLEWVHLSLRAFPAVWV